MKATRRYVVCVRNEGAEDLELRKIYEVLPDTTAAKHRLIRVIDESGEDYLYPASLFVAVELPPASKRALADSGKPRGSANPPPIRGKSTARMVLEDRR